ncbi:MAG: COX15/CtaA family protein [Oceanospirillaceae bacterium]|nr:COX15/CtaA family protein [Oceanospirillaceae bacterium]
MAHSLAVFPAESAKHGPRHWALLLVNAAIVLVILVVLMGGWTRINDAGLSCPDWPGCFGQLSVPNTTAQIESAAQLYPNITVVQSKGWLEMVHRYLAASLSLLILGLTMIAIALRKEVNYPHLLSYSLLVLVGFQAALGMWTVTLKLLPIIVTAHLFGGLLTAVLLLLLRAKILSATVAPKVWATPSYAVFIGLVLLFLQILLGGWTSSNYAGWGCSDWLACNPGLDIDYNFSSAFVISFDSSYSHQGGNLPLAERGAIQISHRVGAMLVTLYFLWLQFAIGRHQNWSVSGYWLVALTLLQVILGLMNIAWAIPTFLAMAHHFIAVIMLLHMTRILTVSYQDCLGDKKL